MSMACLYVIDAYSTADEQALRRALEAALDEVDRIDRLMSHYKPESPLSAISCVYSARVRLTSSNAWRGWEEGK